MKAGDWIQCLSNTLSWYDGKIGRIMWVTPKGDIHAQFDGHEVRIPLKYVRVMQVHTSSV